MTDGTGFPFEVQPTDSCRRFLDLAHINQRILVDLLLTCSFDLCGDMEVLNELFPKMGLECRGSIVFIHLACCDGDPNPFEVEHLKSAEPQDLLCSGVVHLRSGLVQGERGGIWSIAIQRQ